MNSRLILVCLCLVLVAQVASALSHLQWVAYKNKFGKTYTGDEDRRRMAIFAENERKVREHNTKHAANLGYTMEVNHMSDWIPEERGRLLDEVELEQVNVQDTRRSVQANKLKDNIPDQMDWRKVPQRVSRVKDQGQCATGWAFATTGLIEGQISYQTQTRPLIELSEQNLIDCSEKNKGCTGGSIEMGLSSVLSMRGIESEEDYPYEAIDGQCRFNKTKIAFSIKGFSTYNKGDEEGLKVASSWYGPIAVGMDVEESFFSYKTGVYYNPDCNSEKINHAVLIVGYGVDPEHGDYWLVKNSWGEKWGDKGYFKIARNKNNHCGITTLSFFADF